MNEQTIIEQYLQTVIKSCGQIHQDEIAGIYHVLLKVARNKGKIYLCGNGGSSSTASHFQSDLNRAFAISCQTMPAVCLTDNIAALTAVANDVSYEDVFCHQLKYQLEGRDALVAVSASGNSANVIKAAEFAKEKGCIVIALVGFDGGRLPRSVPSDKARDPSLFDIKRDIFQIKGGIFFAETAYFNNAHINLLKFDFYEYCNI